MAISGYGHTSAEFIESTRPDKFSELMMRLALNSLHKALQQTDKDRGGQQYKIIGQNQTSVVLDNWLFITTTITIEY